MKRCLRSMNQGRKQLLSCVEMQPAKSVPFKKNHAKSLDTQPKIIRVTPHEALLPRDYQWHAQWQPCQCLQPYLILCVSM